MAGRRIGSGPALDAGGIDPFVTNSLQVLGIKELLKELNKVDKSLRRQITQEYKSIVSGVISDAENMIPLNYPLRNWKYKWAPKGTNLLPWGESGNVGRVYARINTKKTKEFAGEIVNVGTFVIRWDDPAGALFDFAQNGQMAANLTAKYGSTSRVMWKAWTANQDDVLQRMKELVERVQRGVQEGIDRVDATKVTK